jgi:hypothetical protein
LLADGSNNAFITDTEHLAYLEKSYNGTKKFTLLKEVVLSDYLGFKFINSDLMFHSVSRIIGQLFESGIAKWIVDNETPRKARQNQPEPVPLTFHHLGVWFYVFLSMLFAACVLFVVENFVHELCHREPLNQVRIRAGRDKKVVNQKVKKELEKSYRKTKGLKKKSNQNTRVKPYVESVQTRATYELNAVFEVE